MLIIICFKIINITFEFENTKNLIHFQKLSERFYFMKHLLPDFKKTFLITGYTYLILALGLFYKGLLRSMSEFNVPQEVLNSAHYYDALIWVYVHMAVIGILILIIGYSVFELKNQKVISLLILFITLFYTYLDFRTADWAFGNSLYKGNSSIVPAIIGTIINLLMLQLVLSLFLKKGMTNNQNRIVTSIDQKTQVR